MYVILTRPHNFNYRDSFIIHSFGSQFLEAPRRGDQEATKMPDRGQVQAALSGRLPSFTRASFWSSFEPTSELEEVALIDACS